MSKRRFGLIVIALTYVSCYYTFGQEVKTLRLDEALELGLSNSKQMKTVLSKSRQGEAYTREMKENMLPDLKVSGQYMRLNTPKVSIDPALMGDGGGSSFSTPKYLAFGTATASLPLFSGFKIRNGIQSAKYLEKAATLDVETQKNEVILNIISAYINLYKSEQAVDLVQEDLEQSQKRVEDFTNLEENGLLALNDLLKAQLMESNTSLALLDAKNNYKVANYNMNLMLGLDENTQLDVDSLDWAMIPESVSLEEAKAMALQERSDLLALAERESAGAANVKITKGEYYPTIGLSGGYIAADIDNMATITNALNIGIGVSFNLAALYKAGAEVQQAKELQLQTHFQYTELTDEVKREVFSAYTDYDESLERIDVYVKAQQQASENYRITKEKHANNLATTTDLLDADVAKFQADLNLRYAKADAIFAYYQLLKASGQLDQEWQN